MSGMLTAGYTQSVALIRLVIPAWPDHKGQTEADIPHDAGSEYGKRRMLCEAETDVGAIEKFSEIFFGE